MCLLALIEELPDNMGKGKAILYQDNAPCQVAKYVQEFLTKELPSCFPKGFIPANSPDLNPLGYCIWNSLKDAVTKQKIVLNYDHLVEFVTKVWDNLSQNIIDDSTRAWQRRVRLVEKANGGYINQFSFFILIEQIFPYHLTLNMFVNLNKIEKFQLNKFDAKQSVAPGTLCNEKNGGYKKFHFSITTTYN